MTDSIMARPSDDAGARPHEADPALVNHAPAGHGPSGFDPSRGCEFCRDRDGERVLPMYGVAPHECFWRKGPQFTIGQSTILPFEQWDDAFVPDLEDDEDWSAFVYPSACGTFYCPSCDAAEYASAWTRLTNRIGQPPRDSDGSGEAGVTGTGTTEGDSAGRDSGIARKGPPS